MSDPQPYLDQDPRPWAAHALAWFVLLVAALALVVSVLLTVPETVSAPFTLVPVRGAAPIRAVRGGVVREAAAVVGDPVVDGALLYVIAAPNASDGTGQSRILSPCRGTLVDAHGVQVGTAVAAGDAVATLACDGERLRARLVIPQHVLGHVVVGQAVKLRFDAFPYERFGAASARVAWISPATTPDGGAAFTAFATLESAGPRGRALGSGMSGQADILIGRRRLIEFVLDPLRQLREDVRQP